MLKFDFSAGRPCIAMLRHQNASQGIRDDYQDLLEDYHERPYKDISVCWGEGRNCREVFEETEEDANTEEWQRYHYCGQNSPFITGNAADIACALSNEEEEANVDHQKDDEAGFDQLFSCASIGNRVGGQTGPPNDADDERDRSGEL